MFWAPTHGFSYISHLWVQVVGKHGESEFPALSLFLGFLHPFSSTETKILRWLLALLDETFSLGQNLCYMLKSYIIRQLIQA